MREEARVGQRTTLDVLNAQQELVNARVALVTAQRDRVVASYTLLSAAGRLSARVLGLGIPIYDPSVHYHQVRDSWVGVRTPDGQIMATRSCMCVTAGARLRWRVRVPYLRRSVYLSCERNDSPRAAGFGSGA